MSVAIRTITRVQDADDLGSTPGAGNDGYALTWDNGAGEFVLTEMAASGLAADGSVTGATAQAQAFTNGIIGPSWKPSANSTTALQLQNAAGTSVLNVDTTNSRIGIGTTAPVSPLHVIGTAVFGAYPYAIDAARDIASFYINNTSNDGIVRFFNQGASKGVQARFIAGLDGTSQAMFTDSEHWIASVAAKGVNSTPNNNFIAFRVRGASDADTEAGLNAATRLTILGSGNVGVGTTAPGSLLHGLLTSAATNAVTNVLTIGHDTSGTAAAGFGAGQLFNLESSTTAAQAAARIQALWYEATHATRKADLVLAAYDTAEREGLRIRGAGSAPALGFYGVSPIERATLATGAGASVDDVITALQNLGLVKQS